MKTLQSKNAATNWESEIVSAAAAAFSQAAASNRECDGSSSSQAKENKDKPMKTLGLFIVLLALLTAPRLWADGTFVSGIIDGEIWTAAGSPYCVIDHVMVASLMIQPGVEVRFLSNYVFMVEGRLQAKGAAGNEVRFTTTNSGVGWQGIWFLDSVPGSFFEHCIIEYSKNSAVRITNSAQSGGGVPAFTNCTIINNSSPDYGGGIHATLRSGDLVLDNCVIRSNTCGIHGGGINAVLEQGTLKMVHCDIVSNIANVATTGGSYVGGGIRISGDSLLLNCWIGDNICYSRVSGSFQEQISYGGGLYSDTGNATLRNCRFQRNVAETFHCCGFSTSRAWGGAVYFQDGHLTVQNCIVDTNTCSSGSDSSGAGIFVQSGTADLINCTIVGNNTQGLYRNGGTVNCLNSILYFNNSSSVQIGGTVAVTYSDVQGGTNGGGNIAVSPNLRPGTLELLSISPCIDMGNPDPRYNDSCFLPSPLSSRGTNRNDMGAYGGPAACCWSNPCEVVIVSTPQVTCFGMDVLFCVNVTGAEPFSIQWRFHGNNPANPPMNIADGTNVCLSVSNVQSNNAGYYSVLVSNPFRSIASPPTQLLIFPACYSLHLHPGLSITGIVGRTYCIQYTTDISGNSVWAPLTNFTLNTANHFYADPHPATLPRRFYRVIEGACP